MKRPLSWTLATAGALVVAACAPQAPAGEAPAPQGAPQAPAAAASAPASVYAGVYSAAQANRGQTIQRRVCGACHTTSEWSGGRILTSWAGQTAFDLVSHLRNTMPLNAPGSLSLQEYTDVFAYMLELNNVPPGEAELAGEEAALRRVTIEYQR